MDARADEHRAAHHCIGALPGVHRQHLPRVQARVPLLPRQAALRPQPVRPRIPAAAAVRGEGGRAQEGCGRGACQEPRALQGAGGQAARGDLEEEEGKGFVKERIERKKCLV